MWIVHTYMRLTRQNLCVNGSSAIYSYIKKMNVRRWVRARAKEKKIIKWRFCDVTWYVRRTYSYSHSAFANGCVQSPQKRKGIHRHNSNEFRPAHLASVGLFIFNLIKYKVFHIIILIIIIDYCVIQYNSFNSLHRLISVMHSTLSMAFVLATYLNNKQ